MTHSQIDKRRKAARKAVATRRANALMVKRWREIDAPAKRRAIALYNWLLPTLKPISLLWNPLAALDPTGSRKLKNGAQYGDLIKITPAGNWLVLPEGYKRPQEFHPGYWQPLYREKGQRP